MSRFKEFLNEANGVVDYKNISSFLFNGGSLSQFDLLIQSLLDIEDNLTGNSEKPSRKSDSKLDGVPLIFGKDPTTRNWFVGYSLSKVCYSHKDILDIYGGDKAEVLKYALRTLPDLHIGGVILLNVLYIRPDVKTDKTGLTYKSPNGIRHIISNKNILHDEIKNSQIGIQVLGKYEGHDIKSLQLVPNFIPAIKPTRTIYIFNKPLQDHSGVISFTANETTEYKKLIEELVNLRKELQPSFLSQGKILGLFKKMEEFSSQETPTTPNAYINAFANWIKTEHASTLNKTNQKMVKTNVGDLINFLNRNQNYYRNFLNIMFTLNKIQAILNTKIDAIQKLDKNGIFVADRTQNHVKLMSRDEFLF